MEKFNCEICESVSSISKINRYSDFINDAFVSYKCEGNCSIFMYNFDLKNNLYFIELFHVFSKKIRFNDRNAIGCYTNAPRESEFVKYSTRGNDNSPNIFIIHIDSIEEAIQKIKKTKDNLLLL